MTSHLIVIFPFGSRASYASTNFDKQQLVLEDDGIKSSGMKELGIIN
jgi:hypothetical protein